MSFRKFRVLLDADTCEAARCLNSGRVVWSVNCPQDSGKLQTARGPQLRGKRAQRRGLDPKKYKRLVWDRRATKNKLPLRHSGGWGLGVGCAGAGAIVALCTAWHNRLNEMHPRVYAEGAARPRPTRLWRCALFESWRAFNVVLFLGSTPHFPQAREAMEGYAR